MTFFANASKMMGSFALAQALPILASPLLTRLFTPDAFGLQALFMSWASALGVIATLRLDLALVLCRDDREAGWLLTLVAIFSSFLLLLAVAVAWTFSGTIAAGTGHPNATMWPWFLLPMTAATVLMQMSNGMLSRERRFGPVARTGVINQVIYVLSALIFGALFLNIEGLVEAKLLGQSIAAVLACFSIGSEMRSVLSLPTPAQMRKLWTEYSQFVVFNTPYSLIGTFGREMPIYAFMASASSAAAGFYGLARTFLGIPALLMTASLSQVFYREAAEHRGTLRLETMTVAMLHLTSVGLAPAFAFVCVWGDIAFAVFFGQKWAEAGLYAMLLAPAAWLSGLTSWPERLFEVQRRQDVSFKLQIVFDVLTGVCVVGLIWFGFSPLAAVIGFATVNAVYHLAFLTAVFRVSGFSHRHLVAVLVRGMALFAAVALGLALIRLATGEVLTIAMLVCGVAAAGAMLYLVRRNLRVLAGTFE